MAEEARKVGVDAVVQAIAAAAVVQHPEFAPLAAGGAPVASAAVMTAWDRLMAFRMRNVSIVVEGVASAERLDPQDVVDRLTTDDAGRRFLADLIHAAQDAAVEGKIAALIESARRVATGEVTADVEDLVVRACADLETPHLAVLNAFTRTRDQLGLPPYINDSRLQESGPAALSEAELREALPELGPALSVLLATLIRHGLVSSTGVRTKYHDLQSVSGRVGITGFGTHLAKRFGL